MEFIRRERRTGENQVWMKNMRRIKEKRMIVIKNKEILVKWSRVFIETTIETKKTKVFPSFFPSFIPQVATIIFVGNVLFEVNFLGDIYRREVWPRMVTMGSPPLDLPLLLPPPSVVKV